MRQLGRFAPVSVIVLACTGCVTAYSSEPVFTQVTSQVAVDDPNCRDYSAQVMIERRQQQIVGRACQQSDGTWRIVEGPPGQPPQIVVGYTPPPYAYYPYYDPWLWGPPIGLSLGASVVFVDRFRGFHHFRFAHGREGLFAHRHDDFRFAGRDGFRSEDFHHGFGGMHHGFGGFGHTAMGGGHHG